MLIRVVSYIFLITGFYVSSLIIYLKYDIVLSPDFEKYFQYFEQYSGAISYTNLDQGNVYFFLTMYFYIYFQLF